MKTKVFCGWGVGPDVGINYERTAGQAAAFGSIEQKWFVDLTAKEARIMAAELIACAEYAEKMEREMEEQFSRIIG